MSSIKNMIIILTELGHEKGEIISKIVEKFQVDEEYVERLFD